MRQHKYTLPRHTNLASQGSRTAAFFVDLAIFLGATLAFFFGCFNLAFKPITKPANELINEERINSGLYEKGDDGEAKLISSNNSYEVFIDSLKYYYFNYLPGKDIKEGLEACKSKDESYDVAWFNLNVLEIGAPESDKYFVYQKNGEEDDLTKVGVRDEKFSDEVINKFVQGQYVYTIQEHFNHIDYIASEGAKLLFYPTLGFALSAFISGAILYVVVPWILKNGQTVGKKIFKLGLADNEGYKFRNSQLLMRFMPLGVLTLSLIMFAFVHLYVALSILLIIFLVSFALAIASPKKTSLHDLCARTIVVDLKNSILFENSIEEDAYILKEDNINPAQEGIGDGEEPDISYEK